MRGITKSSKTKSTFSCAKSSSASCPSCAGSAENALASKIEHTTLRIVGLSSTTRIRALISEGPSIVPTRRPQRKNRLPGLPPPQLLRQKLTCRLQANPHGSRFFHRKIGRSEGRAKSGLAPPRFGNCVAQHGFVSAFQVATQVPEQHGAHS